MDFGEAVAVDATHKKNYMREYRKRMRQTPDGRAKLRAEKKRWKQSENGKKYNREWANKQYVPSNRVRKTEEELRQQRREYQRRRVLSPAVKEKRRLTAYWNHIKRTYDITPDQYKEMAINGCHICGEPDDLAKRLHVDHCHATGRVRGLLCDPCNRGLGCFRDNTIRIEKALSYLRGG